LTEKIDGMSHEELKIHVEKLTEVNRSLKRILSDIHPLARRAADNNPSHLVKSFNFHTRTLLKLSVNISPDYSGTIWARDPNGREFDGLTDEQAKEGCVSASPIIHEISYWKNKYLMLEKQFQENEQKWYDQKIKDYHDICYWKSQSQSLSNEKLKFHKRP
jgi:hypothetical protein